MDWFISRAIVACASIVACGASSAALAPLLEPNGEITLAQAVDLTLRRNPDLIASSYEIAAARARIEQADLRPNPEVSLELENFAGGGERRDVQALETTLSLGQVVELGGKRPLRRAVAEVDLDLVDVDRQARELDVLSEVTRRFIDVVAAQEQVRWSRQSLDLSQRTLDAIEMRVKAARSPEAELSRGRIGVTRARIEERQAQSILRGARASLASTWGAAQPAFTEARADLFAFSSVAPFEQLLERVRRSPDFLRFASQARLHEAQLRVAQAQARPNLTLSLGVRHFNAGNDAALVAGFSMPLPVSDRNQGAISEALARRSQSEAEHEAAYIHARATLYSLYQEMQSARTSVEVLRAEAEPQAQAALDQTRYGYERGRFSFLELITAQQDLLELRHAAIRAAADYHRLLAELERLTHEPLPIRTGPGESP